MREDRENITEVENYGNMQEILVIGENVDNILEGDKKTQLFLPLMLIQKTLNVVKIPSFRR